MSVIDAEPDPRPEKADQARAQEVEALLAATKQIIASLDLGETLNSVLDSVVRLTGSDPAAIRLLDDSGEYLACAAARGTRAELVGAARFRVGQGLTGMCARSGEVINVPDIEADPRILRRHVLTDVGLRSVVCLPLRNGD